MTERVLLTFRADWADEFDVYGFDVVSQAEWEEFKRCWQEETSELQWGFGTNEEIHWPNGTAMVNNFKAKIITDEQFKVLDELFGSFHDYIHFGNTPYDHMAERAFDEDPAQV